MASPLARVAADARLVPFRFFTPARADKIVLVAGGDKSELASPFGVDFDKADNLYFVEMTANRLGRMDVNGKLTIQFADTPWDEALDRIIKDNGLAYTLDGKKMHISVKR